MKIRLGKRRGERGSGEKPNGRLGLGLLLIGTGRPAGFAQFGASVEAFLASLAPLLGFLIVLGLVLAWSGRMADGVSVVLTGLCALLAPIVVADLFCRRWQRRQNWALYANVLNCAQWLMLAVLALMLPVAEMAVALGLSNRQAAAVMVAAFAVYVMWFHWFAARHALDLSRKQALLVMLAVVFGTGLLLQVPPLLAGQKVSGPVVPGHTG